jgi:hypothetical protein
MGIGKRWKLAGRARSDRSEEIGELADTALFLNLALPESGYASLRVLAGVARYQAQARAFGMVRFLQSIRSFFGRDSALPDRMPGYLVRDIGFPELNCAWSEGRLRLPGPAESVHRGS